MKTVLQSYGPKRRAILRSVIVVSPTRAKIVPRCLLWRCFTGLSVRFRAWRGFARISSTTQRVMIAISPRITTRTGRTITGNTIGIASSMRILLTLV